MIFNRFTLQSRLTAVALVVVLGAAGGLGAGCSADKEGRQTLRFGVGPLLPTTTDTETAWRPFFSWLAKELDVDFELQATTDWAGISVAMQNDQIDLAWMGPFGYVLANHGAGAEAIATAKYDEKPFYHAIVVAPANSTVARWPDDAKGKSISFADVASTSGWLVPTHFLHQRGIDPKTYFKYSEGATHAANEVAVTNGKVDLATDFDRNRNAMIEAGTIKADASKIVWQSEPLPNDAIAVAKTFDVELAGKIRALLTKLTPEQAGEILPKHYTGFVAAGPDTYKPIQDAAVALKVLK